MAMTKQEKIKTTELLDKLKKANFKSDIAFMCGVIAFEKNNVGKEIETLNELIALVDKYPKEEDFFNEISKKF